MKFSLQFKMALMFFVVMLISASISISALLLIFSPIMESNGEEQLRSVVLSIKELEKTGNFSSEEIVSLCTNSAYSYEFLKSSDESIADSKKEIDEKGFIIEKDKILPSVTIYTQVNKRYLKIDSFTNDNVYWIVNFVIIIAFIACIVLGTIITGFISKSILQPIRDLNVATSEVAKGNFAVRVRESQDMEYGKLTRNFNRMAEQLSGIETLRGDFISNVSHEFKTPLASIQGFAKLLQDENLSNEDRAEYTQVIIDETGRLSNLASNILKLSKLENQTSVGRRTIFSLDEQIRNIILVLESAWEKKNILFDINLDQINYFGNEEFMAHVWQNLISNAIKFTPENGTIRIELERTDRNITAKVIDNGIGISEDAKFKIFEKFYQSDNSRKTDGNGLGLALVKRIVDLAGGKVTAENIPEGGACFTVELPYVITDMK